MAGMASTAVTPDPTEHSLLEDVYALFTGTTDYVILLSARNMEDYQAFVEDYLVADPQVVLANTNVVIRPLKMGMVIPIDEPAGQG